MSTAFPREHRIKLSSFWEGEKKALTKWPIIGKEPRISLLSLPVVDFPYKEIEAGKTLFSLQFIENLARVWIPCDFQELCED